MTPRLRSALHALVVLPFLAAVAPTPAAAQARPITPDDLWSMGRVGAPVLSPDGRQVAYTITRYDLETNGSKTDIWLVPTAGGAPVRFTGADASSREPVWSPDGRSLVFISNRDATGAQLWLQPVGGGDSRRITAVEGGVSGRPVWSADGRRILFSTRVWPEGDAAAARARRLAEGPSSAQIYDELMVRHWDSWRDGRRNQVFVLEVATGETRNATPGAYDSPPIALGGFQDYHISPDGREIAFVRNVSSPDAVGTGNDVWLVPAEGGEPRRLTEGRGNDVAPQYSPDGRYVAYLSMERPGFEADRKRLMLYDRARGTHRELTEGFDRSVYFYQWSGDSRTLHLLTSDEIHNAVYRVPVSGGRPVRITHGTYDGALAVSRDGRTLVVARQATDRPTDLYALDARGRVLRQLTRENEALVSELALQPAEPFWFQGAGGTRVQGFLVKPPGFDPSRRYPVVYLVHGGPQGVWADQWHYRWNANMFAAPGYVAVLVNPRGSTGYGQRFTDEISQDWGGKVFEDLMLGLDHVLEAYPFLDGSRVGAAGASYGGYMMNWFAGNTDRFRALINHAGLFDIRSMYGATEELWFPEWEFGGTLYENPEGYERWNPVHHVQNFRTPMLVIHGQLDYRVPVEQGLQTFTALRRNGVPARLLYFPDENHWILKPQNAMVWWETMYEWLDEHLR
jgi:dipeptidyl aminopeptidase/acylaminoacyl peptidase